MSGSRFGIFYPISRIVLAVLTAVAIIGIIVGLIDYLDNNYHNKVGYIVWTVVCLIVAITGFWGAWKEHFMSCLIYGIVELILVLAGISFADTAIYTRVTQVFAIVFAFIFSWMLHVEGRADYSLPCHV